MTTENPCPVPHPGGHRKSVRAGEAAEPGAEVVGGTWHVRSLPLVRQVLREGDATVQAGFNAETAHEGLARTPVLFMDGPEHRRQRAAIARYFTPATVGRRYRGLMEELADELVEGIRRDGGCELSRVTMRYSVEIAAQVVGLTESGTDGMSVRLDRFFGLPFVPPGEEGAGGRPLGVALRARVRSVRSLAAVGAFFLRDVRPAIAARRAAPREDVISHLLEEGYGDREILTECITYAAAGMATTREFIAMAAWHLLDDPRLRERYLAAEEAERYAVLHEILRLEPVVGHLYRRAVRDLVLVDGDERHEVPAGAVLDLYVRQANADPGAFGDDALSLCPARERPTGARPEGVSFGDGPHRCPGNFLAIQESDVFLQRLLRLPLELAEPPRLGWEDLIAGYQLRDVALRVRA